MSNQEHDESLISTLSERIWNGLVKENPTFVLLLGMCPTLAVTTSAVNGLGMGVTTLVVLALSNLMISALRKVIPDKIRIPAFIVIIASFVTIVELLLKAYIPSLYDALGLYIPLIVVNCIILGRAESYAYTHKVLPSLFDGLGMGMGFTVALTIIGAFREILGSGKVFGYMIMPQEYVPVSIFVMAPGAFFVLALLTAIQNLIKDAGTKRGKDMSKIQSGCGGNCMECSKDCAERNEDTLVLEENAKPKKEKKAKNDKKDKKQDELTFEAKETSQEVKEPEKGDIKTESVVEPKEEPKEDINAEIKSETDADVSANEVKVETTVETETKVKSVTETASEKKAEKKNEKKKAEKPKTIKAKENKPVVEETKEEDELVLLDLNDYKKAIQKTSPNGKKPTRKKASVEKAQALLSKANETLKEDGKND